MCIRDSARSMTGRSSASKHDKVGKSRCVSAFISIWPMEMNIKTKGERNGKKKRRTSEGKVTTIIKTNKMKMTIW